MPDGGQWMTVREFAQAAEMSQQRVSQLLHKSLQEFHKSENGRIFVNSDALQIVLQARQRQGYKGSRETVVNSCAPDPEQAAALEAMRDLIDRQAAELEKTRAQLEAARADLTAAQQTAAVATAERNAERQRADDLREALQAAQHTQAELAAALTAAQALHAGTIRGQLDTAADAVIDGNQVNRSDDAVTAPAQAGRMPAGDAPDRAGSTAKQRMQKPKKAARIQDGKAGTDPDEKRGLFARLFRKR